MDLLSITQLHAAVSGLIVFLIGSTLNQACAQGAQDYCLLETFSPKCNDGEVILINSAFYGMMKVGKCVDPGSRKIGCYADVLKVLDSQCSGKQSCSIRVMHPDLAATNPCNSVTLPYYLSVSYKCVQAANLQHQCQSNRPISITSSSGFISNQGIHGNCPVIISTSKGSKLNLTLYNFLQSKERAACYEIAKLKDGTNQKTLHICENNERKKPIHVSTTSTIEITFTPPGDKNKLGNFLIQYKAIGCPSPLVPENAHAIREGDTATIVCNNSDTTWTTTCKDNKWTQVDRECPSGWSITKLVKTTKEFPYGIFLTSIIGVGLGVLIGGFLLFLAINAFQRYQRRGQQYGPPPVIPDPDYKIYDTAKMDLPFVPGLGHSTLPRHQMAAADVPPAPPPLSEATMKRLSRHTYERPNFPSM